MKITRSYSMNNTQLTYIIIAIIIEHFILAICLVVYKLWRTLKCELSQKKYIKRIQTPSSFEVIETKELYLEQKVFIETPEVGVYQKRLYKTQYHMHKRVNSLLYILKGRARVKMGVEKDFIIGPGQFLQVPARVKHDWKVIKPDTYVEYLEIASPSFANVPLDDTSWEEQT